MIIKEKCDDASPLFHRDQEWRVGRLGCSSWGSFKIEVPLTTGGNIFVSIIMPPGVLETQLHTVGDGSSQKRQMEHVRMLGSRSFNCTWNHLLPPFSHSPWDSEFACSSLQLSRKDLKPYLDATLNLISQAPEELSQREVLLWFLKSVLGQFADKASTLLKEKTIFFFLLFVFC